MSPMRKRRSRAPVWIALLVLILLVLGAYYLFRPVPVATAAMQPTIPANRTAVFSLPAYWFAAPQRGDVIAYRPDRQPGYFVGRIIGLPGDLVQMTGGRLFLNGEEVPRIQTGQERDATSNGRASVAAFQYEETLPGGPSYIVNEYADDRSTDDTPEFTVPENAYFILGDNRDNALDSRAATEIGFASRSNILGQLVTVWDVMLQFVI